MMLDSIQSAKAAAVRSTTAYAAGRDRHEALAPYATPAALLEAMLPTSALDAAARDAIVVAFLKEHQAAGGFLWQSLLLATFEPMLLRLRGRLGHRHDEDVDQRVLLAFFAALRVARAEKLATLSIRWATLDEVKAMVRADWRGGPRLPSFDEETHACDPFGVAQIERTAVAEIARIVEARGGEAVLAAILATHATGESLAAYVRRTHAGGDEKARAAAYVRLHRVRGEILADLRTRLTPRRAA